jgi:PiT family inorganic phosphate transporter
VIETLILILVFVLAVANGANDVSKGIATLVSSKVLRPQQAILWGTVMTGLGGLVGGMVGVGLLRTFSSAMLAEPITSLLLPLAMAFGTIAWLILATRTGMPVSTTHALTGGLIGAAWAQAGATGIVWGALVKKIALPLAFSPVAAFAIAWLILPFFRWLVARSHAYCLCLEVQQTNFISTPTPAGVVLLETAGSTTLNVVADKVEACDQSGNTVAGIKVRAADALHIFTSGLTSFARGMNDAPKIAALLLAVTWFGRGSALIPLMVVTAGMCVGGLFWGRRVLQTLSHKITAMDNVEALTANACSSALVSTATFYGLPLSTTHVTTSAIVGVGAGAQKRMDWRVVREILLAWLVTLPVAAMLAYVFSFVLQRFA